VFEWFSIDRPGNGFGGFARRRDHVQNIAPGAEPIVYNVYEDFTTIGTVGEGASCKGECGQLLAVPIATLFYCTAHIKCTGA
jgi:hypothetical protein